jgi:hypothetical protein
MATPYQLRIAYLKSAEIIERELTQQSPYKTGALRKSIKVVPVITDDGVRFTADYKKYGVYVDRGTGPYKSRRRGAWNPSPGKGKGGIKPRFWTTISRQVQVRVKDLISKATLAWIKFELRRLPIKK